jgi:hypothetical protein
MGHEDQFRGRGRVSAVGVEVMVGVKIGEAVKLAVRVGKIVSVGRAVIVAGSIVGASVTAGSFEPHAASKTNTIKSMLSINFFISK